MARPRRFLFLSLAAVVVGLAVAWLLWPHSAITLDNAAKIQKGMTVGEVEAILGGPARNESTGPTRVVVENPDREEELRMLADLQHRILELSASGQVRGWTSDRVMVHVQFDSAARVTDSAAFPLVRTEAGPLAMLRRWLGL